MKTIDCTGMLCPKPIIETKRAIGASRQGDTLKVIIDNDTSLSNLRKFLSDNGINPSYSLEKGKHILIFTVSQFKPSTTKPEEYCEVPIHNKKNSGNYLVILTSNFMGSGSEDLGELLMKGFLSTLSELDKLPQEIICYNSGVKLAVKGTPTAMNLKKLFDLGVKITLCGTCVDFFKIKQSIEVGEISNMYYIAGRLTSGLDVVNP